MSLAPVRSDQVVASPCPLAISRGALAVRMCALTLTGCKFRLAQRVKQLGGAIMQSRGGVVDRRCV
jgi:hypothetical protein